MRPYIQALLTIIILGVIGFQIWFDIQVRKTFGAVLWEQQLTKSFIVTEFPDEVAHYNDLLSKQSAK